MKIGHQFLGASFMLLAFLPSATMLGQPSESNPYAWIQQKNARPFVEFSYGLDWPRHKALGADLASIGMLEMSGGYHDIDTLKGGVFSQAEGIILASWYSPKLGGESNGNAGLSGTLARFGFGTGRGYGYDLDGASLIPYFRSNASWTQLLTDRPPNLAASDNEILNRYEGTYRFGVSAENGVRANFGRGFSLSGACELNVIYPRVVFWEWLGSSAMAGGANGVVTFIGKELLNASPAAVPIVVFVLKSALTWGIYQLWRTDMNWPFDSETPLTHETLKFSLGYTF